MLHCQSWSFHPSVGDKSTVCPHKERTGNRYQSGSVSSYMDSHRKTIQSNGPRKASHSPENNFFALFKQRGNHRPEHLFHHLVKKKGKSIIAKKQGNKSIFGFFFLILHGGLPVSNYDNIEQEKIIKYGQENPIQSHI